jgi:hypothetical protein
MPNSSERSPPWRALPYPRNDTGEAKYDAALALASDLADRILNTRANPEDPMRRPGHRGLPDIDPQRPAGDGGCTPRRARRTDTRRRVGDQVARN